MGRTEAQGWWGEAPALELIFAKPLTGFDEIVREADSLPSLRPSAKQLQPGLELIDVSSVFVNQGARLGSVSAQSATISARAINPCVALESVPEPRPTKAVSPLRRNLRLLAGELG